ncbi:hypothetical protein HS088_TW21G00036 [Tripterygium wilfordii]|uniref:Uncharacterized protein n=1 Tax=Tripterygium wilfordii TaxID=458696 RepID=A0A7J7C219_TRIWF|nr:uncharacterized protein LOC119989627 [Tripterygium wilfordii]XP_038691200.1 uncharacterized protein LOC119989627 [Tripterygium wilfordii]KAF5727897.1 hypothetical protein HS088_TW21G00036 [Tripterygium wilfordii]
MINSSIMEKSGSSFVGLRQSDLKKSFKLALRSLLTTCSKEEFDKAFSRFTGAEQECLHQLFVQVITSLHESIEEEFESLFLETQVGPALNIVEQLVEEQSLDPLFSEKTNFIDVAHDLSMAKKNEIHYLGSMLNRAVEQKRVIEAQIIELKNGRKDVPKTADIEKLRNGISSYGTYGMGFKVHG